MHDDIYDAMPDDPSKAFLYFEEHFRNELETSLYTDHENNFYHRNKFMSDIRNVAEIFGIPEIVEFREEDRDESSDYYFSQFELVLRNVIHRLKIQGAQTRRQFSVHLSNVEREKIRHYIEQIKTVVEGSDASTEKREAIFAKLNALLLEIDRERTRFEVIADGIRAIARLSGDFEREGAEPWWKWVKLIFGVVDDAKEKEPKNSLPPPTETKRLEAPRKQLPKPREDRLDDDIPF
ncbi:hypothetical protein [Rhizobium leguminosarum]|uniref:hypothetical protein n=1 Tax=Rhizobium leguminosarum TaxID=384 RepID=UPI001C947185|nr:hypothetical protein [Rhizobium leguminosarum]MBY5801534.1 hypothetical protein [Rhizobium leguminosarum]